MEFKAIAYLIMGLGYVVYSIYKKANEARVPSTSPKPKTKTAFDEAKEEMRRLRDVKQQKPVVPKRQNEQQVFKGKEVFTREKINPAFEEGMSAYKVYDENVFKESISTTSPITSEIEEETPSYDFDARTAIINSIILERKF